MSEQKPRLLPFRLRRRGRPAAYRGDEPTPDAELRELLRAWAAPAPPEAARARLLASFRAQASAAPRWRRLLAARVSVPVPVAAAAVAALVFSAVALAALARGGPRPAAEAVTAAAGVKVVEVPVPQERVVTRVVYVERPARASGARTAPARRAAPAKEDAGDPTSYFTGLDMAEFRPADEMKIRVIKRGRPEDEAARPDGGPERKTR